MMLISCAYYILKIMSSLSEIVSRIGYCECAIVGSYLLCLGQSRVSGWLQGIHCQLFLYYITPEKSGTVTGVDGRGVVYLRQLHVKLTLLGIPHSQFPMHGTTLSTTTCSRVLQWTLECKYKANESTVSMNRAFIRCSGYSFPFTCKYQIELYGNSDCNPKFKFKLKPKFPGWRFIILWTGIGSQLVPLQLTWIPVCF